MSPLDSTTRIAPSLVSPLAASRWMYPSNTAEAKRQRSRDMRSRQRTAGMTEIVLVLPKACVDQLDAQKSRHGLRNRGQVVEQLLSNRRSAEQQTT
jgi:hypothetical protein